MLYAVTPPNEADKEGEHAVNDWNNRHQRDCREYAHDDAKRQQHASVEECPPVDELDTTVGPNGGEHPHRQ